MKAGTELPRYRLGVALLLDDPVATEVDGLRRALGASSLARVVPHLTLVPPVNVRAAEIGAALAVLRQAAAAQPGPLKLHLGPPATFWPQSPVVHLPARGSAEAMASLWRLHDMALQGVLLRPERWPWAPHVTLDDEATPEGVDVAVAALAGFEVEVELDRVVLMQERDHVWSPLGDANLGPPVVVGRGGLQLEIVAGRVLSPDLATLLEGVPGADALLGPAPANPIGPAPTSERGPAPTSERGPAPTSERGPAPAGQVGRRHQLVLSGWRQGALAGVAVAWAAAAPAAPLEVAVAVEPSCRGEGVGRALLGALELAVRRQGWWAEHPLAHGPAEFYRRASPWAGPGA